MPVSAHSNAQIEPLAHGRSARAALVTGGGVRIGRAISLALARAGFSVAFHTRSKSTEAGALAAEIASCGVRAANVVADLADHDGVLSMVPNAVAAVGALTVLVNNASEFADDDVGGLDRVQWDRHFAVNLRAPVFLSQAFADQVPRGVDACIVNITDQRTLKPVPRQFSYTLTKCALHAATILLAQALAPKVRVNAVAPGPTLPSPRQDAAQFAEQTKALPLERGPRPEDIAATVVYLVSAERVTGETIAVDGGQHIAWKTPDVLGRE